MRRPGPRHASQSWPRRVVGTRYTRRTRPAGGGLGRNRLSGARKRPVQPFWGSLSTSGTLSGGRRALERLYSLRRRCRCCAHKESNRRHPAQATPHPTTSCRPPSHTGRQYHVRARPTFTTMPTTTNWPSSLHVAAGSRLLRVKVFSFAWAAVQFAVRVGVPQQSLPIQ